MKWGIHHPKWSRRSVVHSESRMVLRGEHHVTHPGNLRESRPFVRVKSVWIECFRKVVIEVIGVFLGSADKRVADPAARLHIDTPMDKQPETLIPKPLHSFRFIQRAEFRR